MASVELLLEQDIILSKHRSIETILISQRFFSLFFSVIGQKHSWTCEYFVCSFAQLLLNVNTSNIMIQKGQVKVLWVRWVAGTLLHKYLSTLCVSLQKSIMSSYKFFYCFACRFRWILATILDCIALKIQRNKIYKIMIKTRYEV